ncbi:MAG: tetratricopeptide repeat protein [Cyanobacteriota bacterium]
MVSTQTKYNYPQQATNNYTPYNGYNNYIAAASPYQQGVYNSGQINPYQQLNKDQLSLSQSLVNQRYARQLKIKGNEYRLQGKYDLAIQEYTKALQYNPDYTDVLYNLGRTYRDVGKINDAINTFNKLLQIYPNDFESRTLLGEFHEEAGSIDSALSTYRTVLQYEPNYDYAKRNYQNAQVKKIALTNPKKADAIVQQAAKENLQQALQLIQQKAPAYISANLQGVTIAFGLTEQVNKYENLAQYENSNKRILISNKLVFASPNVIATYLVHEAVHAGDKDPITSVTEEQDAFREMTKFWVAVNNGVIDPDLTLAMKLYLEHPSKLDQKVEDLYVKRDPSIRKTSPSHGEPSNNGSFLDTLYDKLRSMLPVQSIYNPYQLRDAQNYLPEVLNGFSTNNTFTPIPAYYNTYAAPITQQFRAMNPVDLPYDPNLRYVTPNLGINYPVR